MGADAQPGQAGADAATPAGQEAPPGPGAGPTPPERAERDVPGVPPELALYRATIDNLDAALVHLLAERFRCTQRVGHLKAELDLPASDPQRERRQVARLRALALDSGLDPVFAEKFFAFIVQEVIRHHEAIRESRPDQEGGTPETGLPEGGPA